MLIGAAWFGALPFDGVMVSTPGDAAWGSATPADVELPRSVTNGTLILFLQVRFKVVGRGRAHLSQVSLLASFW